MCGFQRVLLLALAVVAVVLLATAQPDGDDDDAENLEQYRRLHALIDRNKDGKINVTELVHYRHSAMRKDELFDAEQHAVELDVDLDGKVSMDEFLEYTKFAERYETDDEHVKSLFELEKVVFASADKNGDGFVEDASELVSLLHPNLDPVVYTASARVSFKQRDKDGDGMLSMLELYELPSEEHLDREHMQPEFESVDTDGDSRLNLEEFTRFDSGLYYLEQTFQTFMEALDSDGDGHATVEELEAKRYDIESGTGVDDGGDMLTQWIMQLPMPADHGAANEVDHSAATSKLEL